MHSFGQVANVAWEYPSSWHCLRPLTAGRAYCVDGDGGREVVDRADAGRGNAAQIVPRIEIFFQQQQQQTNDAKDDAIL